MNTEHLRRRFWAEIALALSTAVLAGFTLVWKEWLEIVFRVDPDAGSGSLEWLLVGGLLVATVSLSVVARLEVRRAAIAPA